MTDTTFPVSASKGGDNAYYLGGCRHVEHSPAYCACLAKLDDIDRVGAKSKHSACYEAARLNNCQAKVMRAEEITTGKAMYYVPRQKVDLGVAKLPAWSVPPPVTSAPKVAAAQPAPLIDTGTYADAINAGLRAPAPQIAVTQTPAAAAAFAAVPPLRSVVPPPAMQAGETPMQYARRIAAARESA